MVSREQEEGIIEVKLDHFDGRDEQGEDYRTQRHVCSVQHKLVAPCTDFPKAAVPRSGGGWRQKPPSVRGPQVTAGPEDVVQGSWEGRGGELTAICCSSHCDSGYFEAVCLCTRGREGEGREEGVLLGLFRPESTGRETAGLSDAH